jgi:hypothetical protein
MVPHYLYDWTEDVARYRNILGGPALTLEELILDAIDRHAAWVIIGNQQIAVESLIKNWTTR